MGINYFQNIYEIRNKKININNYFNLTFIKEILNIIYLIDARYNKDSSPIVKDVANEYNNYLLRYF